MIPYSRQKIDSNDIKSVIKTLKSDLITQGTVVPLFEKNLKDYTNSSYAIMVNNASNALIIAVKSLNFRNNSIAWTVSNSYVATANAIIHNHLKIDFVDIDYQTMNICPLKLEEKLIHAKKNNCLPKLLITVHLSGNPVNQKKIYELSKKFNFIIIEDASHALGSVNKKYQIGSNKYCEITIFSFHPVKTITSAEGGAITTNNKKIYEKLIMLRENGVTKNHKKFKYNKLWPFAYEQHSLGYNFRMADLNASLGNSQLKKIDYFVKARNKIASTYIKELNSLPLTLPSVDINSKSSFHLFIIRVEESLKLRNELMLFLKEKNIYTNLHYFPIHLQPFYRKLGFKNNSLIETENNAKKAISIPIYVHLSDRDLNKVINAIKKFF